MSEEQVRRVAVGGLAVRVAGQPAAEEVAVLGSEVVVLGS